MPSTIRRRRCSQTSSATFDITRIEYLLDRPKYDINIPRPSFNIRFTDSRRPQASHSAPGRPTSPRLWGPCVAEGRVRLARHFWLLRQLSINQNATMASEFSCLYIYGQPRASKSMKDTTTPTTTPKIRFNFERRNGNSWPKSKLYSSYQPRPSHCCSNSYNSSSKRVSSSSLELRAS